MYVVVIEKLELPPQQQDHPMPGNWREEMSKGITKMHKGIHCNQMHTCPTAEVATHRNKNGVAPRRLTRVDPRLPPSTTSHKIPAERPP